MEANASDNRTQSVLKSFVAWTEGPMKIGRFMMALHGFQSVIKASANSAAFSGDIAAGRELADAIRTWEATSAVGTPFPVPNSTWVPSCFVTDRDSITSSLVDPEAGADREILCRFFRPADREILQDVRDAQRIHDKRLALDAGAARFCLLDSLNDCRMVRYPSGRGSQPAIEMFDAADRCGTSPDVPITDRLEPFDKVRRLGWHMDLARVEASDILGRDPRLGRRIGTGAERMLKQLAVPTIPVGSYARFLEITDYLEDQFGAFGHGFSVWYRGQPRSFKRGALLGLSDVEWRLLLERLKKRLTYLDDDDLLIPALFRHYGEIWNDASGVRSLFQSMAAWQLVSDQMLDNGDLFPAAPEVILADDVPDHVLDVLDRFNKNPDPHGMHVQTDVIRGDPVDPELAPFELWAHHSVIVDGKPHFVFKRAQRQLQRHASSTLALQHYGCPTTGLDITFDATIAAIFALGGFAYASSGAISRQPRVAGPVKPCVYVLLLRERRDPFMRSAAMFKGLKNESRIERQKCGILFGSSWYCRNYAQRHIAMKLELNFDLPDAVDPHVVYPTIDEDPLSRLALEKFEHAFQTLNHDACVDKQIPVDEARFQPLHVEEWH